jgi:hypothetical protein
LTNINGPASNLVVLSAALAEPAPGRPLSIPARSKACLTTPALNDDVRSRRILLSNTHNTESTSVFQKDEFWVRSAKMKILLKIFLLLDFPM